MDPEVELTWWVLASLVLFVAGAWLAWRFQQSRSRSVEWLRRRLVERLSGRLFLQGVRLAYYVGLPYAALVRRALSLVVIGMRGPEMPEPVWWTLGWRVEEWTHALGQAAGMGLLVTILLALGWRNALRAAGHIFLERGLPILPWWVIVREVLFSEIHWAFYRAVPLLILDDAYWAIGVSATFPLLEWTFNPDWWVQVRGGPQRELVLMQGVWLATSTVCFFLTRNVWSVLLMHLVVALALNGWLAFLVRRYHSTSSASRR